MEEDWEVHGPHAPEFRYQVYVGYAISQTDKTDCPCVAIYPRAVYEREAPSEWARVQAEQKMVTVESEHTDAVLR